MSKHIIELDKAGERFKMYLRIERSLSANSVDAYLADISKLKNYIKIEKPGITIEEINLDFLSGFIHYLADLGLGSRSQARIVSGIKAFFKFLILENSIAEDPSSLLEAPKLGRKLPVILSIDEIDRIIAEIDLSKDEGQRNKAIIETLYSCGLRVSELVNLKISGLYFNEEFIRVTGKRNKERLVPIGSKAIKEILLYKNNYRNRFATDKENENILFLNRRGKKLTRVMIFTIIKNLCKLAGIQKNVSPHTFRHSFATHLIDGGADLRVIQDMLGHESITTTEIYTHLDRQFLRDTLIQFHPRS